MIVYLGLGSNIGNRAEYLRKAVDAIQKLDACTVKQISSIYETEPRGNTDQPDFLNQVIEVETQLGPKELLHECKKMEQALGRKNGKTGEPRTIDIDLLLYSDCVVEETDVQLPHPRIQVRRFVLVPLNEIAPDVTIPGSGRAVREALEACADKGGIKLYKKEQ
jgi:2-amino-4-hydroxy-6-hydroxymethyldihydropteridine diphosphokinase